MTYQPIHRKIATTQLYDRTTGIFLQLPEPFQVTFYHDRAWNGSSKNGLQYLHIERIPTGDGRIPTILADGDLDMYLVGMKMPEQITPYIQGVEVAGQIAGKDIQGYIAMVRVSRQHSYLIFVAVKSPAYVPLQQTDALRIAELFLAS